MTIQNGFYAARHRQKLVRRATDPTATEPKVPVRPKPTAISPTITVVRPPVKPTVTRALPPPAKPTVTPPLPTALTPPLIPPVLGSPISTAPVTSPAPVIPPPIIATSSLPIPTTSSFVESTASSTLSTTSTHTHATSSISAAPTVSPQPSGGVSTGAVVGGIIGGFAALGLIAAALFLFLRRAREKKERKAEIFDATEFRRSAHILEDPAEKHKQPRPPTMIEQHVQNTPAPRSNRNAPSNAGQTREPGASYSGQSPYGAAYPDSYTHQTQAPFGQYPLPPSTYGYGHSHAYTQHHYPPQPHYGVHYHGTYPHSTPPPLQIPDDSTSGQDDIVLPNPFAPSPVSDVAGPTQRSLVTAPNRTQSDNGSAISNSSGNDEAPPPAYEAAGKFAGYKPDVKVKPVLMTVNSTLGPSSAAAATSTLSASTTSAVSTKLTITPASSARPAGDKNLSERPLSSTSVLTTIYDMKDAYGGI